MHELYEVREKLCKELKKYGHEEITNNSLELIDTLAHSIKNIDKIIDEEESEYEPSYRGGRSGRGTYSRGRGRNAKRDSMGRYASDGRHNEEIVHELRELMMDAPDETTRMEYQKVINKLEMM